MKLHRTPAYYRTRLLSTLRYWLWVSPVWRPLQRLAWPAFDCEDCTGAGREWPGCYCAHHGAIAPGQGPERWRVILRRVLLATLFRHEREWLQ